MEPRLVCQECGKVIRRRKLSALTEVRCPRCGSVDVEYDI